MAEELKWSDTEQKRQYTEAVKFLKEEMGQQVNRQSRDKIPINLSREEISNYIKRFQALDKEKKGYISINDIRRGLKVHYCFYLLIYFLGYQYDPGVGTNAFFIRVRSERRYFLNLYLICKDWRFSSKP